MTAMESAGETIDAAALLDDVHEAITDYVAFASPAEAWAVTLWVVATHGVLAFDHATRLVIKSPEKRCGKSRLMEVLSVLARKSLMTSNISVSALFRSIGEDPPTLFLDEADTLFGTRARAEQHEDLRGLFNAGFRSGSPIYRVVGPDHTPTAFPTFAMACLAGIGNMPDTIEDRAVVISLRRRAAHETVLPYRLRRDRPRLVELHDRIEAWTAAVLPELKEAEPKSSLEDRAADTWEPLLAIVDAAGGAWPSRGRRAASILIGEHLALSEDRSRGLRLLSDIATILQLPRYGSTAFIASPDMVRELQELPEANWKEDGLTTRKLAALLKPYKVRPGHDTSGDRRGYRIEHLADAIARYLSTPDSRPPEAQRWAPSGPDPSERPDPQEQGTSVTDGHGPADGSNRPANPVPSAHHPRIDTVPDARTIPDGYAAPPTTKDDSTGSLASAQPLPPGPAPAAAA